MDVNYDQSICSLTALFEGANPHSILQFGAGQRMHRIETVVSLRAVSKAGFWWLGQHPLANRLKDRNQQTLSEAR